MPQTFTHQDSANPSDRSTSPSLFQHLGSFDLFNNLLFDRERVYQTLQRLSPIRIHSVKKEEDVPDTSTVSEDRVIRSVEIKEEEAMPATRSSKIAFTKTRNKATAKTASKSKTPLAKKGSTKAKPSGESSTATNRKRSLLATNKSGPAAKKQKTAPKANSARRMNGRGASFADAFIISDDEDVGGPSRQKSRTDSTTPPRPTYKIDTPDSEDDLNPAPAPIPTLKRKCPLEDDLANLKAVHADELEQVRTQLRAITEAQQLREKADLDALELQHRQKIAHDNVIADLYDHLESLRHHSTALEWECDYLRREEEAARSRLKGEVDLIQQRDEYERLYDEVRNANTDLTRDMTAKEEERKSRDAEKEQELQRLVTEIKALQHQLSTLQDKRSMLKPSSPFKLETPTSQDACPSCQTSAPCQLTHRLSSPTPSLSQSTTSSTSTAPLSLSSSSSSSSSLPPQDADQRLVNLRRTYISTKKRYDNLYAVAGNIVTVTRGWDPETLGELGGYVRVLRGMVAGEGGEGEDVRAGKRGAVGKVEGG